MYSTHGWQSICALLVLHGVLRKVAFRSFLLHVLTRRMIPWTIAIATFFSVHIITIGRPAPGSWGERWRRGVESDAKKVNFCHGLTEIDGQEVTRTWKKLKIISNPMVDHHLYSKVEIWVVIPIFEHAGISSCGFYAECVPIISHYIPIIFPLYPAIFPFYPH